MLGKSFPGTPIPRHHTRMRYELRGDVIIIITIIVIIIIIYIRQSQQTEVFLLGALNDYEDACAWTWKAFFHTILCCQKLISKQRTHRQRGLWWEHCSFLWCILKTAFLCPPRAHVRTVKKSLRTWIGRYCSQPIPYHVGVAYNVCKSVTMRQILSTLFFFFQLNWHGFRGLRSLIFVTKLLDQ